MRADEWKTVKKQKTKYINISYPTELITVKDQSHLKDHMLPHIQGCSPLQDITSLEGEEYVSAWDDPKSTPHPNKKKK